MPGADLDRVHYLRVLEDSEQIKAGFGRANRVAIVGAGWIGLETAAAARAAGLGVTLLETAQLPLLRVGAEVAPVIADLHRDHGVDLRCDVQVTELVGGAVAVTGVRLGDGDLVDADLVLVGVGITPNTGLAEVAGLDVSNGIDVDEHLCTSDPDIYAAGDVANAYHPRLGQRIRVEHWANAERQGTTAAMAMLGQGVVYDRTPYFFSDQYDVGMEYTGHIGPAGYDDVIFRGDPATRAFIVFWLATGRVLAGMNVNTWDVADAIENLIHSDRSIDVDNLSNPAVSLDQL